MIVVIVRGFELATARSQAHLSNLCSTNSPPQHWNKHKTSFCKTTTDIWSSVEIDWKMYDTERSTFSFRSTRTIWDSKILTKPLWWGTVRSIFLFFICSVLCLGTDALLDSWVYFTHLCSLPCGFLFWPCLWSTSGDLPVILDYEELSLSGMVFLYLNFSCFQLTCSPVKYSNHVFF